MGEKDLEDQMKIAEMGAATAMIQEGGVRGLIKRLSEVELKAAESIPIDPDREARVKRVKEVAREKREAKLARRAKRSKP